MTSHKEYCTSTADQTGNIALSCSAAPTANLLPRSKRVFTLPTFDQTTSSSLVGNMFYELHPQLWGQGIMGEAFREVLRYAFEVVGCTEVTVRHGLLHLCCFGGIQEGGSVSIAIVQGQGSIPITPATLQP